MYKLNPAASLVYSLFIQFTVVNSGMCSSCYYSAVHCAGCLISYLW